MSAIKPKEAELVHSVVYPESFETIWDDVVVPLAKRAPYMFQSQYYAHQGASIEAGGKLPTEKLQKKWSLYATDKLKGMSHYAGD